MDARIQARLNEILRDGYSLNFGDSLGGGFRIFGKQAGLFIGFTVLMILGTFISVLIPFVNILVILGLPIIVIPCLFMGYVILSNKIARNEQPQEFRDLFGGFKYIGQMVLFALTFFVISIILSLPALYMMGYFDFLKMIEAARNQEQIDPRDMIEMMNKSILWIIINYLVSFALYTFAMFVAPLINDGLSFGQALVTAVKITGKKFFLLYLIQVVSWLILAVGTMITCGLGLLVLLPVYFAINVSTYNNILKLDNTSESMSFSNDGLLDS